MSFDAVVLGSPYSPHPRTGFFSYMKGILASFLLIVLASLGSVGQRDERTPPKAEEREAQILAADFFKRLQETQDISLLLKQYFIEDFSIRLKYCGTSGECGGFGRDFWQKNEELTLLNGTERDYERDYINSINYLFLYFRSIAHQAVISGQKLAENEESAAKEINQRLKEKLKDHPEALKLNFWENPDEPLPEAKTLDEFRGRLVNFERLNAALRVIEKDLRVKLSRKHSKTRLTFTPKEFRVYKEPNKERFFRYPASIQMFDVWAFNDSVLLKIDMVRERGKLRIVAVYPPMD